MQQAEEIRRGYKKPDELMLQQGQMMCDNFVIDQPLFVVKVPSLVTPYETLWQSEIDTAQAIAPDVMVVDYMQVLTHNAQLELVNAQDKYQILLFYIKLAYPKDLSMHNMFGADRYNKARLSQLKMIDLMEQAHTTASEPNHVTALTGVGYTQAQIDELLTVRDTLYAKNRLQENAKNKRLASTYDRITAYNNVWKRMADVSYASKLVFKDNYTKIKQYLLYPEGEPVVSGKIGSESQITDNLNFEISLKGKHNATAQVAISDGTKQKMIFDGVSLITLNHTFAMPGNFLTEVTGDIIDLLEYHCNNSSLTSLTIPDDAVNIHTYVLQGNKFTTPEADGILVRINSFGTAGVLISLADNEPLSAIGLAAKAELESRGWTVIVAS